MFELLIKIVLSHLLGDFVLQPDRMVKGIATKKFKSPRDAFQSQVDMFYKPNLPYAGNGVITANSPYEQARRIADSGYYS